MMLTHGPLTILADDLTGACDTGTLFAGKAPVPVTVWPRDPVDGRVRVLDTETRGLAAREAAGRLAAAAAALRAAQWFKKIDSTLRGRIGAELDALMDATGVGSAVLTPAFPAQRRTVVDRVLMIDGTPIAHTTLADDPEFPEGAGSSVLDRLRPQLDRPLAWIPLNEVRAGVEALSARLERLDGTVAVADAETDADLEALVDAALALEAAPLLAGSAGLARALAARLGLLAERVRLPRGGRWLIVAGSRHPATRRQIAAARATGLRVLASPEAEAEDRASVAADLAAEAAHLIETETFDIVAVTGGQTALALCRALGMERIDLAGAPRPGLAFGYLRAPRHPGLPVLTKAGGFGSPDLFVSLLEETTP